LIQTDIHEGCLNIEQRRLRAQMLAHAAEVERRFDPATRNMDLQSSQFWWTDKSTRSAIASNGPATGPFASGRTSKGPMPLGQLGPPRYTDFFRGTEPNDWHYVKLPKRISASRDHGRQRLFAIISAPTF
jgi:hypothetical protein